MAATKRDFPMEAVTAHHGRGRNTAEVTGVEKASKAKVEMARVKAARVKEARVRAVEKAAVVAANGKRNATAPSVKSLERTLVASPRMMQTRA